MIFIQPKFIPPKGRRFEDKGDPPHTAGNAQITNFWMRKPTFRMLNSQVPFIENMPFQRTLDYGNPKEVRKTLSDIVAGNINERDQSGYIPEELTPNGMKRRMTKSLSTANYCQKAEYNEQVKIIMSSDMARDCIGTCQSQNMTCSTEYFHLVNDKEFLLKKSRKFLVKLRIV